MIELLTTKLFIPRPRLIECLNTRPDKKLTLIVAPVGFGETTLLSTWIPQSPRYVIWFSLDEDDNDPVKFWAYFIKSVQGLRAEVGEGGFLTFAITIDSSNQLHTDNFDQRYYLIPRCVLYCP